MMTRKDFERIAQVFRVSIVDRTQHHNWPNPNWYKDKLWLDMRDNMITELKAINPRFDEERFKKACDP